MIASRRQFLAVAASSMAGAAFLEACGSGEGTASAATDEAQALNDLLTLEYVEAAFYTALVGSNLFTPQARKALGKFGEEEEEHIAALTKAIKKLGSDPAPKPKTSFSLGTATATLELASKLENVGAAAYLGQLPKLGSDSALSTALSIHSVEGRHAAAINDLLEEPISPDGAFAKPAKMKDALASVKPYIATAVGSEPAGGSI